MKLMASNPKKITRLEKYELKVFNGVPIALDASSQRIGSTSESKEIKSFILSNKGYEAMTH
jgi:GTP cyclohydrolase II